MITSREQQILDHSENGLRPRQIATRMGISVGTVDSVLRRLNGNCRSDSGSIALASANLLAAIKLRHPEELLRQPGGRL